MPPLIAFKVTVHDQELLAALRETSREMRQDVKRVMLIAAERKAVPLANAFAPSFAKGDVVAKATTANAYLTFRNGLKKWERGRNAMMEFGGSIRTPLHPQHAKALRWIDSDGNVIFRMSVKKPRKNVGKHYMQRAADESIPEFIRELEREIPRIIQNRIDMAKL